VVVTTWKKLMSSLDASTVSRHRAIHSAAFCILEQMFFDFVNLDHTAESIGLRMGFLIFMMFIQRHLSCLVLQNDKQDV